MPILILFLLLDFFTFVPLQFRYGLAGDRPLQHQVDLHGNSVSIHDLTPGSDYRFEIQSFLGSDFSQTTFKNISTSKNFPVILSTFGIITIIDMKKKIQYINTY